MISLPNLPHDNLYKFLAFAGLAIVVSVSYLYFSTEQQMIQEAIDLATDRIIWRDQFARRDREFEKLLSEYRAGKVSSQEFDVQVKTMLEQSNLSSIEDTRLSARELRFKNLREQFWINTFIMIFGTLAGTLLIIVGCRLWYVKIQKPQDQLLAKDSIPARRSPRLRR